MLLNALIEGLQILQPYYDDKDGYHTSAEHDIFYAYGTDKPLPESAVTRLCELGWFQEDVDTGDDDFKPQHYDPNEGWAAFT